MASSTSDDAFHEIQLNGKQLVFLFMAVTVVAVVIFLCGVLVGRGVRDQRMAADPIAGEAVAEAATDVPPPAAVPTGGAPVATGEDLSYPNRLGSAEPPQEALKPAPPAARSEPAAAPVSAAANPPAAESAGGASDVASEPGGPGFAIQVSALRQRDEADAIARRLSGKGYPAYVVAPVAGAPAMFRVRVGKFTDRREAESVKARLEKEEQFKPWIVP